MIINPVDLVVLVDDNDNEIGLMEKFQAHTVPTLHRAVSVFIFNSERQMLLQRRAESKYHSASLWTNTACTHPYPGESNAVAAARRLKQEMGLETQLREIFH
jgi:isopentenyl-diphosphate delta-isomerase